MRSIKSLDDPLQLANAIANYCHFKTSDKQGVLEAKRAVVKLQILSELLGQENELLELENKIDLARQAGLAGAGVGTQQQRQREQQDEKCARRPTTRA